VRALQRVGFVIARTSGSHTILERQDGRFANVPVHATRDLPPGTLAAILKSAGTSADELRGLL
jgi:predicted RNA binding protein YcfA (HicA-like mRNA interferase family)